MPRFGLASLLIGLLVLVGANVAPASTLVARDAKNLHLYVRAGDRALVTFTAHGVRKRVLVSGALNALAPNPNVPQVQFRLDYAPKKRTQSLFTRGNGCRRYDGPRLAFFSVGCKASDGSYWAIQAWKYWRPFWGYESWLPYQDDVAFHISHWTGPLAELELFADWIDGGHGANSPHDLIARLTYGGMPAYGYVVRPGGVPGDGYGRVVYMETLDSLLGPGWQRLTGILTRNPSGTLCHAVVPLKTYSNYPNPHVIDPGNGKAYRAYVEGPGVTPLVMAEVEDPGDYDPGDPAKVQRQAQGKALLAQWHAPPACLRGH